MLIQFQFNIYVVMYYYNEKTLKMSTKPENIKVRNAHRNSKKLTKQKQNLSKVLNEAWKPKTMLYMNMREVNFGPLLVQKKLIYS